MTDIHRQNKTIYLVNGWDFFSLTCHSSISNSLLSFNKLEVARIKTACHVILVFRGFF